MEVDDSFLTLILRKHAQPLSEGRRVFLVAKSVAGCEIQPRKPLFLLVENGSRSLDPSEIFAGPDPDAVERHPEGEAEIGQFVLNFRWDDRVDGPADRSVALHRSQGLCQHLTASTMPVFSACNPITDEGPIMFQPLDVLNEKQQ
jgi:hypothetical protein